MAQDNALEALQTQTNFLKNAEDQCGNVIAAINNMQEREQMDVSDAIENRNRFLALARELDGRGLSGLARVARDGAALEEQQIERNSQLIADQSSAKWLLLAIAGGIGRLSKFFNRISRAFQVL